MIMRWLVFVLLFHAGTYVVEAQSPVDLDKEKAELLRLHRADREAHFKTDVALLLEHAPEEFLYVSDGKVYTVGKQENAEQIAASFRGAKYSAWDDLDQPVIRISKDASMAWMITRIKVRRTQKDARGAEKERKFVYAGIMVYEKQNGKWIRVANVSTFEPGR
jgi:hypothetical protein